MTIGKSVTAGSTYPFYTEERIALFIDGANLYAASKALEFDIDYRKLLSYFSTRSHLLRANYYTLLSEDQDYSPLRPLVDWLDYNGFHVITNPIREYTDYQGRRKTKGTIGIDMTVDVMEMSGKIDHAVIFTGDTDFQSLVHAVQRQGMRVTIVSTIKTNPSMIADELRRQADHFLDLSEIQPLISRKPAASEAA
ncbi:MAG: NYN domain-containing protein [Pseudobdellovibrionaceae bacterium]